MIQGINRPLYQNSEPTEPDDKRLKERGWPLMAWLTLRFPIRVGGRGFRDLHGFNFALLGRCFGALFIIQRAWFPESLLLTWDDRRVCGAFSPIDVASILQCPISPTCEDTRNWGAHSIGVYSVRSGYHWLMRQGVQITPPSSLWLGLSRLHILPKLILLYNLRNRGNVYLHEGRRIPRWHIISSSTAMQSSYTALQISSFSLANSPAAILKKPKIRMLKINVDGAFRSSTSVSATGIITRDHTGMIIVDEHEVHAITRELQPAIELQYESTVVESDATNLVLQLQSRSEDLSVVAFHPVEARNLLHANPHIHIRSIRRSANSTALAFSYAAILTAPFHFSHIYPECIATAVITRACYG
ncbi:hypothetical protein F3Y22_tig00116996pilonHSYRG00367 [Hibiscus syriacus]|uniref:RNase H type-1 domain-containing protein n=1 Tax=Hibiscus syriacus TaxID=106335 RepID=A0A6A2XLD9_HIBSY|nr:hypothetical protein F3Y22_tig00116996pilonHSYRG00367 [Hibiscus syriacus]